MFAIQLRKYVNIYEPIFSPFTCGVLPIYKMLGYFNPNLGQIWTNPNVGLKM